MGKKVAVVGDLVGGGPLLNSGGQILVRINGIFAVVPGANVTPHGPTPHDIATMLGGSLLVRSNGFPLCLNGDLATCGDFVVASGFVEASN
jgi:uncharacterized Zn-binding protein involved in type VI secretion